MKFKLGAIFVVIAMIVSLMIALMLWERVPPGHVGVQYKPGSGIQEQTLSSKWHFIPPFDTVTIYPTRKQTVTHDAMTLATKDGKNVTFSLSYTYNVDPAKVTFIFDTFGPVTTKELEQTWLQERLYNAARRAIAQYSVLELYGEKSGEATLKIEGYFKDNVTAMGFVTSELSLGVPVPDSATQAAIDARVGAEQELDRKLTEERIAEAEANRKRAESQGIADAQVIEAQGQAEANRLLEKSLTPEIIQYKIAEAWNGQLPQYNGGGNEIISLPKLGN